MKALDLFSGLGGWSEPFKDRGHDVFRIDIEESFEPDLVADIMNVTVADLPWKPDIILASPPCEKFSVMRIGTNWNLDNTPKTPGAQKALEIVAKTTAFINEVEPSFWVMENPRGKLRKLDVVAGLERRTVTYCQYGGKYMKPTDLWGGFPPSLTLRPVCTRGAPCHVAAARGSYTGTQDSIKRTKFRGGMIEDMSRMLSWSEERKAMTALNAKIPYQLALAVCEAAEQDLGE